MSFWNGRRALVTNDADSKRGYNEMSEVNDGNRNRSTYYR